MTTLPTPPLPEVSQHALSRLARCERLFELAHLKRERWPAPDPLAEGDDPRRRLAVGDAFHRLVRLHARGQDVASFAPYWEGPDGPALEALWARYASSEASRCEARCYSEQALHVVLAGLRVVVRFDRLERSDDGCWLITDWKTGRSFDAQAAETSWQTRLYRLALATGGHYFNEGLPIAPAHIALRYWHVPTGDVHRIPYDAAAHEADLAALAGVARQIAAGIAEGFRRTTGHCPRCPYDSRCRTREPLPLPAEAPALPVPQFRFPRA